MDGCTRSWCLHHGTAYDGPGLLGAGVQPAVGPGARAAHYQMELRVPPLAAARGQFGVKKSALTRQAFCAHENAHLYCFFLYMSLRGRRGRPWCIILSPASFKFAARAEVTTRLDTPVASVDR